MTDIICGPDAIPRRVVRRDGWWVVEQAGEVVSGGFPRKSEAIAEAHRLSRT